MVQAGPSPHVIMQHTPFPGIAFLIHLVVLTVVGVVKLGRYSGESIRDMFIG